ncbi:MAG: multidrug efflux RND transporter periplasmic adaptor subunit VmeC [Thermodesulfovibrionales bacterium]
MNNSQAAGRLTALLLTAALALALAGQALAQKPGEGGGPPPAPVVVAEIKTGLAEPVSEFVGTVYYPRVSDVSAEVAGQVREVRFEEGRRVKEGEPLVLLSSDLLEAQIESTRATYEQVLAQLEKAGKDLRRMEALYKEDSVAQTVYEEHLYREKELDRNAASLKADLERLALEREKKTIRAPFGGVVIDKPVEPGEWVSPGDPVAVVGEDSSVDVIVAVPAHVLPFVKTGRKVDLKARGDSLTGRVEAVVPRGDVATRTFSVKVRLQNRTGLLEGMEARVFLPSGDKIEGLVVPRDALSSVMGMDVIFVVRDSAARMVPVAVTGYSGLEAGVRPLDEAAGLAEGMQVVVQGNARLQDGQPVQVIGDRLPGSGK